MRDRRTPRWVAAAWALGLVVLILSASATTTAAQDRKAPSARELWETYPLDPEGEGSGQTDPDRGEPSAGEPSGTSGTGATAATPPATPTATVERATDPTGERSEPSDAASGGSDPLAPVLLVLGLAAAATAGVVAASSWRRRRHGISSNAPVPAADVPPKPTAVPAPDPRRRWLAEVEWHQDGDAARFRAVARTPDGQEETVISESARFEWPPASQEAVRAFTRAAHDVADAVGSAGWSPIEPGRSWYAKRFVREPDPAPAEDRTRPPAGRFVEEAEPDVSPESAGGSRERAGRTS